MNLTKTALKRPVSCVLIVVALVVFSISSLLGFKLELTPSMELPMLIVVAMYPGADPETVDELVTKVIEDAGSSLSGVEDVTAISIENMCQVLFQYEYGVDIDECYADLRSALDTASLSLPEDVDTPTVIEMNMNSMPNMYISATEAGFICRTAMNSRIRSFTFSSPKWSRSRIFRAAATLARSRVSFPQGISRQVSR